MNKDELTALRELLFKLQRLQPCYSRGMYTGCVGYQNCNFGENGCYGGSCAIEDVLEYI